MGNDSETKDMIVDDNRSLPIESLSEDAIRKELISQAIQHPTTILPLTLSVLSIVYLGFFPVIPGGTLVAAVLLVCSGLMAAGSFFWRYSIRHTDAYAKRVQEIMELQKQAEIEKGETEIEKLLEFTQNGFQKINLAEGLKAVKELNYEYKQLQLVLEHKKETDPLGIAHIPALADETYRQGLSVLADAFEVGFVIHSSNKKSLTEEIKKIEREIELLDADKTQAEKLEIKRATMASHKNRLDMVKQQQLRLDKLHFICDRCEASLHLTRMELAALKVSSSETSVSAVTDTLQKTINQAKEVQEELKKLGY